MAAGDVVLAALNEAHCIAIGAKMRKACRDEVMASGGYGPEEACFAAMRQSELARVALLDGEPLAAFGVVSLEYLAIPWALTTDLVDRYPMTFWRASKRILRALMSEYPLMVQRIDARHTASLRWVRRLGFKVESPTPFGAAGLDFHAVSLVEGG